MYNLIYRCGRTWCYKKNRNKHRGEFLMSNLGLIRDWDTARLLILKRWDKLKAQELEKAPARFDEIVNIIQKHYHDEPKPNIESDLKNLIDQIDR